ncbi:gamma-butyrobetaine dioxygenase-like [Pollicipes pollicipes]|uniref:gamma-butyrobetaine dioxygenase-like n=1 Tax=Pollicipes pollicipes TaxID=41117 RepID=UPI001884AA70|nr:gamma-butyrobetaine dioxygenase-like [Pollicipes pollicipes]
MASVSRCARQVQRLVGAAYRRLASTVTAPGPGRDPCVPPVNRPDLPSLARTGRHAYSALPAGAPQRIWRAERVVDNRDSGNVVLTWDCGEVAQFPYVWLRDSCLCLDCYHPSALSRKLRIDQLDVNIAPLSVQNDLEAQEVVVTWPDGHVSRFPHDWLGQRQFTPQQLEERKKQATPMTVLWNRATMESSLLKVDYQDLLGDLGVLREALHRLISHGLVVVRNSPTRFGVVEKIASHVGLIKVTHYGTTFKVTNKVDANNLAYTNETLAPHTDQPYYEHTPGVQMLHCISQHQGSGGENTLTDSFYVAQLIRQQRPDLFKLLSVMPFEFFDVGVESEQYHDSPFHKVQEHTMFRTDREGKVTQVCFNNPSRSYRLNVPLESVKPMFEGLKMFQDLSMQEENHVLYKMVNGDVLVFNNRRVLHGRRGYTVTADSTRTLEGGYIDWDELLGAD